MTEHEQKLLEDYSKERKLDYTISVQQLIDSHRRLQDEVVGYRVQFNEQLVDASNRATMIALNNEWISIAKLRKLSVRDLANLIGESK